MFTDKPKFGPEQFDGGVTIIRQGDVPEKFYIITKGEVEVLEEGAYGEDVAINRLGVGEYFGEIGMVKWSRRVATIRTLTAVEVMAMDQDTFHNWMSSSVMIQEEIEEVIQDRVEGKELQLLDEDGNDARSGQTGALAWPKPVNVPTDQMEKLSTAVSTEADSSMKQFNSGETIIRQGDPADTFYIIVEGLVEVTHKNEQGQDHVISRLTQGQYFGEIGLLEGGTRIATIRAASPVKLMTFDRDTFKSWMDKSPDSQDDIMHEAERRRTDTGLLSMPDDYELPKG